MIVATTPRLLLRRWTREDAVAIAGIYGDPETMRQFGDGSTFTVEEVAQSLDGIIADYASIGYGNYAVIERATNTIVGHTGAHYVWGKDRVEADWVLGRQWWGRGYATEAASAVFWRAFVIDDVAEITGVVHRENAASIGVMRKLGMNARSEMIVNGIASVLYAVEQKDFNLSAEVIGTIELS